MRSTMMYQNRLVRDAMWSTMMHQNIFVSDTADDDVFKQMVCIQIDVYPNRCLCIQTDVYVSNK